MELETKYLRVRCPTRPGINTSSRYIVCLSKTFAFLHCVESRRITLENDMPKLTKIYTKTGDDGTTSLGTRERVSKDSVRVRAYGDVDELNSMIGAVISSGAHHSKRTFRARRGLSLSPGLKRRPQYSKNRRASYSAIGIVDR